MLNEVAPKRIVTTCPHCLHTLKNEYPAFGGNFEVIHHTQLINELIGAGRLKLKGNNGAGESPMSAPTPLSPSPLLKVALHDPCYLGRQNGVLEDPRAVLQEAKAELLELPRHGKKSFCCGAGGGQMWKEEEEGVERVNANRFKEAVQIGANTLAVGCPFCMVMLSDARNDAGSDMQVLDVAEIVLAQIER
jgi:Fe-S oxidoreductase